MVPLGDQFLDDIPQIEPGTRVETGGRLVEEQHRRIGHQRARQVQAPAHTAGVALHRTVGGVAEPEAVEQFAGPVLTALGAEVVEPADHLEILEAGEVFVDRGILAGGADARAQGLWIVEYVDARDGGGALIGYQQSGQNANSRGLSRAIGAEKRGDGTFRNGQVESVQGDELPVPFDQTLGDDCVGHDSPEVVVGDVLPSIALPTDKSHLKFQRARASDVHNCSTCRRDATRGESD